MKKSINYVSCLFILTICLNLALITVNGLKINLNDKSIAEINSDHPDQKIKK